MLQAPRFSTERYFEFTFSRVALRKYCHMPLKFEHFEIINVKNTDWILDSPLKEQWKVERQ